MCDVQVFTWGYNGIGQIGNESTSNCSTPFNVVLGNHDCEQIYMYEINIYVRNLVVAYMYVTLIVKPNIMVHAEICHDQ